MYHMLTQPSISLVKLIRADMLRFHKIRVSCPHTVIEIAFSHAYLLIPFQLSKFLREQFNNHLSLKISEKAFTVFLPIFQHNH